MGDALFNEPSHILDAKMVNTSWNHLEHCIQFCSNFTVKMHYTWVHVVIRKPSLFELKPILSTAALLTQFPLLLPTIPSGTDSPVLVSGPSIPEMQPLNIKPGNYFMPRNIPATAEINDMFHFGPKAK